MDKKLLLASIVFVLLSALMSLSQAIHFLSVPNFLQFSILMLCFFVQVMGSIVGFRLLTK